MSDELLREATRNYAEAIAAKDAEIERLDRLITLKNRQLREYADENAKLQAVVDAVRFYGFPDGTAAGDDIAEALAALEEADDE